MSTIKAINIQHPSAANANIILNNNGGTTLTLIMSTFNAGSNVAVYGTWTPNVVNGNYQTANSNGAFTIAAPVSDCVIDVLFSNGTGNTPNGAGTITFSGFKAASGGGGDTYSSVANNQYILTIKRINSVATYVWKALQ